MSTSTSTSTSAPRIRAMTRDDIPAAIELLREAGLAGASGNLARYLAWQPACGWVAQGGAGDPLAGSVTVLRYGEVGFVGCMAVATAHRGTGLGRRLLEHAHAHAGVASFLLEATPAGEPLYRKLGYVATGETVIAGRAATGAPSTARIAAATRPGVLALDRAATGLPRADMLGGLLAEGGPGVLLDERGYGLAIGERLGPVIARDAGAGRALVEALVAPCTIVTAPAHPAALDALAAHGFSELRRLRRMQLGAPPPAPRDHVWALASPGAG